MSSLQDKMYNYEVNPPANSWNRIAAALDEDGAEFPSKLYNMEVAPPAGAWNAISASLEESDEKVIPLRRRTPAFLRYAAAAILIGAAAFGIIKLTGISGNSTNTPVAEEAVVLKDSGNTGITSKTAPAETINNADDIALEQSRTTIASLDRPLRNAVSNAIVRNSYNGIADANAGMYDYEYSEPPVDMADRYIMLMTPEGNIIRMSKKLGDLICCVSGEEQDENCKLQLKKWQEKIAASPIAPSPDNFMGILDLVNSLDEGVDL